MIRAMGDADEFWRLRIVHVAGSVPLDLDWRDDVLYRQPRASPIDEVEFWRLEAVRVDDAEQVVELGEFSGEQNALERLAELQDALCAMTRAEFETAFFRTHCGSAGEE